MRRLRPGLERYVRACELARHARARVPDDGTARGAAGQPVGHPLIRTTRHAEHDAQPLRQGAPASTGRPSQARPRRRDRRWVAFVADRVGGSMSRDDPEWGTRRYLIRQVWEMGEVVQLPLRWRWLLGLGRRWGVALGALRRRLLRWWLGLGRWSDYPWL